MCAETCQWLDQAEGLHYTFDLVASVFSRRGCGAQLYCSYEALIGLHEKSGRNDYFSANCELLEFLQVISVFLCFKQMITCKCV